MNKSRVLEDVGFIAGILLAAAYTLGIQLGPAPREAWAVVAINLTLVAPKMLGRGTAGKIWEVLSSWLPGKSRAAP